MSARCGWFGWTANTTWTVPTSHPAGERGEEYTPTALDLTRVLLVHAARLLVRERRQIPDPRPAGDTVREHRGQPVELGAHLLRAEPADLDGVARCHRVSLASDRSRERVRPSAATARRARPCHYRLSETALNEGTGLAKPFSPGQVRARRRSAPPPRLRPLADEDLSGRGGVAQARRQDRHGSERGVIGSPLESDLPEGRVPSASRPRSPARIHAVATSVWIGHQLSDRQPILTARPQDRDTRSGR